MGLANASGAMMSAVDGLVKAALRLDGPWRTTLARRAARRGLHVAALRAAPTDTEVLIALGMYLTAERHAGDTAGRVLALAGLGRISDAQRLMTTIPPLTGPERSLLARIAAVSSPEWALTLLPAQGRVERASCLIALGRAEEGQALIQDAAGTLDVQLLRAAISAAQKDWGQARRRLNELYLGQGLGEVLDQTDDPLSLGAFGSSTPQNAQHGPLVSVIIAARNAASTLDIALASLQAQTWRSLEIIVVDDGSTDATADRVRARAAADDRIRLLSNTRAPGAYGARNTGIAEARGAFMALHDADDWAHPQRLARQIGSLSSGQAASVCGHFRIDAAGRIMSPRVFPIARLNPILTLVRREVVDRLGAFEETRLGADSEYLARIQAGLGRSAVARDLVPLVVAGWSHTSLMSSPDTGLSLEGLALRVAYVESWRRRHASGRLEP